MLLEIRDENSAKTKASLGLAPVFPANNAGIFLDVVTEQWGCLMLVQFSFYSNTINFEGT